MHPSGHQALVTGASSGLGWAFAKQLAAMGVDIVLTARRKDRLEKIAAELTTNHPIQVTILPMDLSESTAARQLFEQTEESGLTVDILVNNAGFSIFSPFTQIPWEKTAEQLRLNVLSLTELTWLFARAMQRRRRGYILNVSSLAGYLPLPGHATYAAGKKFVQNFTEALAHELKTSGVCALSLCPGGISTEFWEVAGHRKLPGLIKTRMSSPDKVAQVGLAALFKGKVNQVPGLVNKLAAWFIWLLPRRWLIGLSARVLEKHKGPRQQKDTSPL